MKNFDEIVHSKSEYLNAWRNKKDVICSFEGIDLSDDIYLKIQFGEEVYDYELEEYNRYIQVKYKYDNYNILFAAYDTEDSYGKAFVIYEYDGVLYEINGSHCSCYGLEDQWEPEEVNLKELHNRLLNGTFGEKLDYGYNFKKRLCDFLNVK